MLMLYCLLSKICSRLRIGRFTLYLNFKEISKNFMKFLTPHIFHSKVDDPEVRNYVSIPEAVSYVKELEDQEKLKLSKTLSNTRNPTRR